MDVLIQAQIKNEKTFEISSTSVRLNIPRSLSFHQKEEMIQAGRRLAWNRLFRYVGIKD